jgi:cytochrome c biogenesis protein CcmG, thiol:disulfide interchange protein DsbE
MQSRRRLPLALVAAAAVACLILAAPAWAGVRKGDRVTDFVQAVDAAGKQVSLRHFKDQVIVVTFGASWCAPCKKELPALEKLARRYRKQNAKVVFFAVNIDTERSRCARFMQQAGLRVVHAVFDPQKSTVESFDPPKMPTTFIIRGGIVRHVHAGFTDGDEHKLAAAIDRELK